MTRASRTSSASLLQLQEKEPTAGGGGGGGGGSSSSISAGGPASATSPHKQHPQHQQQHPQQQHPQQQQQAMAPLPPRVLQVAPVLNVTEWQRDMVAAIERTRGLDEQEAGEADMLRLSQIRCDVSEEARKVEGMLAPGMRILLEETAKSAVKPPPKDPNTAQALMHDAYDQLNERRRASRLQVVRVADELASVDPGVREINYVVPGLKSTEPQPVQAVQANEVVAVVACYHRERPGLKLQEWMILGSQTLSMLRDRLIGFCLTDHANDGPNVRSGFFFIENTFYNDMREPSNLDYSATIIAWAQDPDRAFDVPAFSQFKSADMATTHIRDLNVRLNQPYAYVHQGDCEHVIVFKDLRLIHESDSQNVLEYPVRAFQTKIRRRRCRFCKIRLATKVTYGDRLSGENPAFFCESCYISFHYDTTNRLLYSDFRVYDYHQD